MAAERTAMEAVVVDIGDPKRGEGGAALNASGKEIAGQELQAFGESSPAACGAESSKTAAAIHSVDKDLESRRSGESDRSSPELRFSERSLKASDKKASFQVRAAQAAEKEWQLLVMVLRGRARQWLKRNEMASAAISVCYLVLIFVQIVMEEMPLGDEFNSSFVQIFSWVDLAFLVFFFGEYAGHILVDGFKYFRRTDGTWEKLYIVDATTVVMSLVLSSLNAAKVIDTQLSIFRMFRLLRLLKVAIAIQRVKGRTAKFRNKGASAQAAPPECNWVDAGTRCYDAQHNKLPAPTAKYSAFLSHYKMEGLSLHVEPQSLEVMWCQHPLINPNPNPFLPLCDSRRRRALSGAAPRGDDEDKRLYRLE